MVDIIWQVFEFGDKYRGKYDRSVGVVKSYYASVSGYMDELLWGAIWLYNATDREEYINYVINKAHLFGGTGWAITEFSCDVKFANIQILAFKVNNSFYLSLLLQDVSVSLAPLTGCREKQLSQCSIFNISYLLFCLSVCLNLFRDFSVLI